MPVIYLRFTLLQNFCCLPLGFWSEPLLFFIAEKNPIYLTLHRKEFTWFHYKLIYILSVALVLISRPTGVTRFAALWCPDFPTPISWNQQAVFLVGDKDNENTRYEMRVSRCDCNFLERNLMRKIILI